VGQKALVSQNALARLAAKGFGAVIPIGFQAEHALERLRSALLAKSAAIATEQVRVELEKQRAASEKFAADALSDLLKEREQKFTLWKSETDIFVTELGKRVQARQSFEAQFGQGGLAGNSSTKGLRESFDLQNSIQNSATSP